MKPQGNLIEMKKIGKVRTYRCSDCKRIVNCPPNWVVSIQGTTYCEPCGMWRMMLSGIADKKIHDPKHNPMTCPFCNNRIKGRRKWNPDLSQWSFIQRISA